MTALQTREALVWIRTEKMLEIKYFFIRSRLIEMYFLYQLDRTVLMWTVKLTEFYNYGKPCIHICMSRA